MSSVTPVQPIALRSEGGHKGRPRVAEFSGRYEA
jgi:hypothetical protein